ncbi:hypothetical protein RIF29_23912 [Crotalaria pallida]|uniref:F-box associated beta-propeller type 1 domain-containing protein n=1 Tax=Crotalaria pallida TaxID=3830 RepID=A0AAN9HYE2_CROPI
MEPVDMELFQLKEEEEEYNNNNNNHDDEKNKMKVSSVVVLLSQELIDDEILVRLPAKSLMRFKCVVRYWNALFTNATFITRHMEMQHRTERFMIFGDKAFKGSIINLTSSSFTRSDEVDDVVQFSLEENNICHAYGSHKGFFCLHRFVHSPKLILWNPLTRELKHIDLPSHHIHDQIATPSIIHTGGIGSDPNDTYDLKIVLLIRGESNRTPPSAALYTLSTNSWTFLYKNTVPVAKVIYLNSFHHGVYANGVCHWLTTDKCILCFDFRTNQFYRLDLPPITITKFIMPKYNFLREVNDSIAYAEYHHNASPPWTDIWILEQQNNNNNNNSCCCWTKKFKFEGSVPIYAFVKDGSRFLGPSNKFFSSTQESQGLVMLYNSDGIPMFGQSNAFFSRNNELLPLVLYNSDGQPVLHFEQQVNRRCDLICNNVFKYEESMAPFHFFFS